MPDARTLLLLLAALPALAACTPEALPPPDRAGVTEAGPVVATEAPPGDPGRAVFARPVGGIACAQCHSLSAEDQPDADRIRVGHTLADSTRRPTWWHGTLVAENGATVEDAMRTCIAKFQQRSWNFVLPVKDDGTKDVSKVEVPDTDLDALKALLEAVSRAGPHPPSPAQRAASRADLARVDALAGDATRGRAVYAKACAWCHGPDGEGGEFGIPLAGEMNAADRWRVIEVVRSGPDRSARESMDAWMPFFTPDVLPDQDLADVATLIDEGGW